jgi:RTX calcium-binding nonapeptide repeat (4 copies)
MNRFTMNCRPGLEPLEDRALAASGLLSGGLDNRISLPSVTATLELGVLRVNGTYLEDAISLRQTSGVISVSGVSGYFPVAAISRIEVNGRGGDDVIRLNSEAIGGLPIMKPCIVNGGAGHDTIFGGYGNDQLLGGDGNDLVFGGPGVDHLVGGAGADRMSGGSGNDRIVADTSDLYAHGQGGTDVVSFDRVDPAVLANYDETTMKVALQAGMAGWSFGKSKDGEKITVKDIRVQDVSIENGITTLHLKATIRYQKTTGFPQFSTTGTIKFSVQPQLSAWFVEGSLTSASIKLAKPDVKEVNLSNVPNWLDNSAEMRDFLEAKLAQQPAITVTNLLQSYVAMGGSLGPSIGA